MAGACKDDKPAPEGAALFASEPAALEGPRCGATPEITGPIAPLQIAVVAGAGVSIGEVRAQLQWARAIWADHGVALVPASGRVERIDRRFLLGGTIAGVNESLAGIKQTGEVQRKRAIARQVADPLIQLLRERAGRPGVIDLVVVERIASPRSPVQMLITDLAGLALSPRLDPRDSESVELHRALAVPGHRPTVFLSTRELSKRPPRVAQTVAAHELGHLLGLAHRTNPGNLMSVQRNPDCWPVLDRGQIETARREAIELGRRYQSEKEP